PFDAGRHLDLPRRRYMLKCFKTLGYGLVISTLLLISFGGSAIAQQVFGSIFGTVTDPSGSAVSNAKVTITDVNKGTKSEVTTDASGNFNKGQLIPDTYKLTIEAPGFQKVTSNEIEV